MDKHAKRDITRLKNLLREYRSHIITNKYNKLKQSPYNMEITDVIEAVDKSIEILIRGFSATFQLISANYAKYFKFSK